MGPITRAHNRAARCRNDGLKDQHAPAAKRQLRNPAIVITDSGHRDQGVSGMLITDFGIVING